MDSHNCSLGFYYKNFCYILTKRKDIFASNFDLPFVMIGIAIHAESNQKYFYL